MSRSPCPGFRARHLTLRYRNHLAFEDLSLEIPGGELTALVGPSGCGKTSFLRCLDRLDELVEDCHVSGRLTMDDQDLLAPDLDRTAHRRRVGMIFQSPNPFPFSIRRNLLLPLEEAGSEATPGAREERMEAALREVGLWEEVADRLDQPALSLSGGQQQRLCVARALALRPRCLLLDEPTSALDPIATGVLEDLIARLHGEYTLVLVTHNLAQARRLADRVAVFWRQDGAGRLVESGLAGEVLESPGEELTRAYLAGERG